MSKLTKALTAAAGNAAGESLYVEDVFSTYLYEGNGSTQTITNDIDLSGEGGAVWMKKRFGGDAENHTITDTERGANKKLETNTTDAEFTDTNALTSFNADGFSLGAEYEVNDPVGSFASWTFRKAEKFFDVVTYTGDGVAGREIAHNLGSAPAFVMVKRTNTTNNWICWHFALTNTQYIQINQTTQALSDGGIFWNSTTPDASNLTLGSDSGVNGSGSTYVAYLFASDAGGFGDDGSESIIKCGSYTGNATKGLQVNCGFEPQLIITKRTDTSGYGCMMYDTMRGFVSLDDSQGGGKQLLANSSNAEAEDQRYAPTATGFELKSTGASVNASGGNFIYIAIRRPMKTPESGTEVYNADFYGSTEANNSSPIVRFYAGFPVDFTLFHDRTGGGNHQARARLTGANYLHTNLTDAEIANSSDVFGSNQGIQI